MEREDGYESEMNDNLGPNGRDMSLSPEDSARLERLAASFSRSEDAETASMIGANVFAAHLTTEKGEPTVTSASNANGSRRETSGLPKWRIRMIGFHGRSNVDLLGQGGTGSGGRCRGRRWCGGSRRCRRPAD